MKNTKKIALTIMATTAIFALGINSSQAMFGQGHGKGIGEGQGKGYMMKGSKKHKQSHNSSQMLVGIAKQDVSEIEKEFLKNQYGEEKMARDLYAYAFEKYKIQTFTNISKSEQHHMIAVKVLLDRYDIDAPGDYATDNDLYKTLKNKIDLSKKDAIEVGIMVEKVDIDNILKDIKNTDNNDIKIVFTNIGGASYNHLRGFLKALENNDLTTNLDYNDYLSSEDLNIKGSLRYKLAEKLESEGVNLPEQVSSEYMKKRHAKHLEKRQNGRNHDKMFIKKLRYKKLLKNKYLKRIEKIKQNEELSKKVILKIDSLVEKTKNSTKISEDKKIIKIAIFEALRDIFEGN